MILTCPECATSYFVDDSRIPATGRSVKCTSCGHRWTATPENSLAEAASEGAAEPVGQAEELAVEPVAAAAPPADDLDFVTAEAAPEPSAADLARERARARLSGGKSARSAKGEAKATAFLWASAAALVVALVAGAILFRAEVVKLWPKSQAAYAGLGLPVDSLGLVIEAVHVEPTFQGGRPVISLTGSIRNIKDQAVTAPPLRISMLNRAGKPIAAKIAKPLDPLIPAGATRHFAIAIADPPANAHDLEVTFEGAARQRAAAGAAMPATPAPPPTDARPLAPGTPDSLSEHG